MPEGPELHIAARFVNAISANRLFSGQVKKSVVSTKNPDVDWDEKNYRIFATARGKEVKLTLSTCEDDDKKKSKGSFVAKTLDIVFRFGMSGTFTYEHIDNLPKHAHLQFYTKADDMVLSFTDYRRFGKWEPEGDWGKDRGPCIITEYEQFRENVLNNIDNTAFNKAICETMLNQKFFNGIGNYLRAEILYRLDIPPFMQARKVLEPLVENRDVKSEKPDIIALCNILPKEVLGFNGGYDVEPGTKDQSVFTNWLQCYYQDGMSNCVDHNGRTMWFKGPAGPMVPSTLKSRGKKRKSGSKKDPESPDKKIKKEENEKKPNRNVKNKTPKSAVKEELQTNGNSVRDPNFSPKKTRSKVAAMKKVAEPAAVTTKKVRKTRGKKK